MIFIIFVEIINKGALRVKLILAEKPDQGAKLATPFPHKKKQGYIEIQSCSQFPNGAILTWAIGHLCELKQPEQYNKEWKKWVLSILPIIPKQFEHQVSKGKSKQFQIIKSFLMKPYITEIIIASDAGREGELIIRSIIKLCCVNKPMKRLWLSSLTPKAVKEGFSNLLDEKETRNLYYEAWSRSCADWLVGMNASRAYTLLLKEKGIKDVFSIGRVQTPTLALIVKREIEIEQFCSQPFWEVEGHFLINNKLYHGKWHKEGETRLTERRQACAIASFCIGKEAEITEVEKDRTKYQPPLFFNLSSLQATANKRFKYSPKKTLDIAQMLYTKGYLSYPRTDSSYVTKEEAASFPEVLGKLSTKQEYQSFFPLQKSTLLNNKRYVNEKKVTDHYAIIPTEQVPNLAKLSKDEQNIYDLVVRRLLAAHEEPAIVDYTTVHTLVAKRATFITKGKEEIQRGWRKIIYADKEETDEQSALLPTLEKGEFGIVSTTSVHEGKTQPPKRYTEGQLITLMKTAGKHVEDETLEKILAKTEGLGTEATRAGIITILKERGYIEVQKNLVYATEKGKVLIHAVGNSILASPEMTAKWEQRLSEIGAGKASMHVFLEQVKQLSSKLVEDAIRQKHSWDFRYFDVTAVTQRSKVRRKKIGTVIGSCKLCDGQVIDLGTFYGCSKYKKTNCTFTISKKILGKTMSQSNVKKILNEGRTNVIKGLKKGDKTFNASLIWDEKENRITFLIQK